MIISGLTTHSRCTILILFIAVCVGFPLSTYGDTLSLKIKVLNPSLEERTKVVSSKLPKRIKPENVNDAGGLELKYDPENQLYYVYGQVTLKPREQKVFSVEIEDVWLIPSERFDELSKHVDQVVDKLSATKVKDKAEDLRSKIQDELNAARQRQAKSSVSVVPVVQHMQAYEGNLALVRKARRSIGELEGLSLSVSVDPGSIMGLTSSPVSGADDRGLPPAGKATAMMYVKTKNPASVAQKINLKRYLPKEIQEGDIVDPGGLSIAYDDTRDAVYVYLNGIELGPSEEKVYQIEVKNRWSIHPQRISGLYDKATELLEVASKKDEYASVSAKATAIIDEISRLKQIPAPPSLDGDYIAHYHDLSSRLTQVEKDLLMLTEHMNPASRPSDDQSDGDWVKKDSPDSETILMVIYVIVAFLGLIGFIFLVRWVSASKKSAY